MKNCPECGASFPVHDTRDVSYVYRQKTIIIPAVSGHYCGSCHEITLDRDAVDRYMKLAGEFQLKVDGDLEQPATV